LEDWGRRRGEKDGGKRGGFSGIEGRWETVEEEAASFEANGAFDQRWFEM
jgi:hypothetical protein